MNNRQVSVSIKYGTQIINRNFLEHDACEYLMFLEEFNLWYEINDATDGEMPLLDIDEDDNNE